MTNTKQKGEAIRAFILHHVENNPSHIVALTAEHFSISRQAVHKHIRRLLEENHLIAEGHSRNRSYRLNHTFDKAYHFGLKTPITEDIIWRDYIAPSLSNFSENVQDIWQYGITEIFNNVLEHSGGSDVDVGINQTAITTHIFIHDNGEGIFKKIQRALNLYDERHAVLELAKGKFTTDPTNHTGEGIFFSSRIFDDFRILSGNVFFSHQYSEAEDWILETSNPHTGTYVVMKLSNTSSRVIKDVFDSFTADPEQDYGFTKTIVPVSLTQYGDSKLVSRSQAKRLLARIDKFKTVILDFEAVESIGQAFADEIFRVFAQQHPEIELLDINANTATQQMIKRAKAAG